MSSAEPAESFIAAILDVLDDSYLRRLEDGIFDAALVRQKLCNNLLQLGRAYSK